MVKITREGLLLRQEQFVVVSNTRTRGMIDRACAIEPGPKPCENCAKREDAVRRCGRPGTQLECANNRNSNRNFERRRALMGPCGGVLGLDLCNF